MIKDLVKNYLKNIILSFFQYQLLITYIIIKNNLSNISNSKVFLPNEEGFYPIYQSDKYGFLNQSFETNPDIILIPFVEGYCVESLQVIYSKFSFKFR